MLARCARVAPAWVRAWPGSEYLIWSFFSVCTTDTPAPSDRLSEPLAPLMVTACAAMVAVTPWGSSSGALAILDMMACSRLGNDAQDFAALAARARLAVGHHALGRGDDYRAHAAQDLRQLVLAAVDAQARAADALEAVDHGSPFEILQGHRQARLAAVRVEAEIGDVALILQHLEDRGLHARGRQLHFGLASGLAVANARQQVSNRISHAHAVCLTSSPWRAQESHRGWRLRGSSPVISRTCGTRRASAR